MKSLLLLLLFLTIASSRENPFEPIFTKPKEQQAPIPLLHINTHKTYKVAKVEPISQPIIITKPATPIAPTVTTPIVKPIMIEEKPKKKKKKKKKVTPKKRVAYKTLYQNYFLKVQSNQKSFKIITKDALYKKTRFTNPDKVAFDFERLQHFHTKNITLNTAYAKRIKFGSHHDFYRITVELHKHKKTKLTKTPYGYLLTFY